MRRRFELLDSYSSIPITVHRFLPPWTSVGTNKEVCKANLLLHPLLVAHISVIVPTYPILSKLTSVRIVKGKGRKTFAEMPHYFVLTIPSPSAATIDKAQRGSVLQSANLTSNMPSCCVIKGRLTAKAKPAARSTVLGRDHTFVALGQVPPNDYHTVEDPSHT